MGTAVRGLASVSSAAPLRGTDGWGDFLGDPSDYISDAEMRMYVRWSCLCVERAHGHEPLQTRTDHIPYHAEGAPAGQAHRPLQVLEDLPGFLEGAQLLPALSLQGARPQLLQERVGTPLSVQDAVGLLLGDED